MAAGLPIMIWSRIHNVKVVTSRLLNRFLCGAYNQFLCRLGLNHRAARPKENMALAIILMVFGNNQIIEFFEYVADTVCCLPQIKNLALTLSRRALTRRKATRQYEIFTPFLSSLRAHRHWESCQRANGLLERQQGHAECAG